jgi:hypothetical protein
MAHSQRDPQRRARLDARAVFELLDKLDAIEILSQHVPLFRRFLLDRLENALRRIERAEEDLDELEAVADALEDLEGEEA